MYCTHLNVTVWGAVSIVHLYMCYDFITKFPFEPYWDCRETCRGLICYKVPVTGAKLNPTDIFDPGVSYKTTEHHVQVRLDLDA